MRKVSQIADEIMDLRCPASLSRVTGKPQKCVDFNTFVKCKRSSWWPYLEAMLGMEKVSDPVGLEDGVMVILYFLNNSTHWRGADARRIKAELNNMLEAAK